MSVLRTKKRMSLLPKHLNKRHFYRMLFSQMETDQKKEYTEKNKNT